MKLVTLPSGSRGIDIAIPVTATIARAVKAAGYDFVMRYVAREKVSAGDLSRFEIASIHGEGLAIGVVQHVKSEKSWVPTADLGRAYGQQATNLAHLLALPNGAEIFCDLEAAFGDADGFCRQWYGPVRTYFVPKLYVGWHCGLTPTQLYDLPFSGYWGSYNLNRDEEPAVRGLQMKQHEAKNFPPIAGLSFESYDVNTIAPDQKGDMPTFIGAE